MNWDTISGSWKEFTGQMRQRWGKLTDDDMAVIEGKQEELVGRLQQHYGMTREEAERQVEDFSRTATRP